MLSIRRLSSRARSVASVSISTTALLSVAMILPAPGQPEDTPRDTAAGSTRNVAIVVWNGAEVLDWAGPSEVFESASHQGQIGDVRPFRVYTVSKDKEPITSQRFVKVVPQYSIADAPKPDILVLPGGGTGSVLGDPEFLAWAGQAAREAEVALSVCTGAFILGKAGLLDGKDATTWYGAIDALERQFPESNVQRGRRFVDNGQVVTTAGVSAGIDGSLHVVARLLGRYVADRTAQYMEYRWTPEPYLAREYAQLNPSLDEHGRRLQQAGIYLDQKNWTAAIAAYEGILEEDPGDAQAWFRLGGAYHASGLYPQSAEAHLKAAGEESLRQRSYYNAACAYARLDDRDRAFESLDRAVEAGFGGWDHMKQDPDLEGLRNDPRFASLMAEKKDIQ